jgi:hypothetical protein
MDQTIQGCVALRRPFLVLVVHQQTWLDLPALYLSSVEQDETFGQLSCNIACCILYDIPKATDGGPGNNWGVALENEDLRLRSFVPSTARPCLLLSYASVRKPFLPNPSGGLLMGRDVFSSRSPCSMRLKLFVSAHQKFSRCSPVAFIDRGSQDVRVGGSLQ